MEKGRRAGRLIPAGVAAVLVLASMAAEGCSGVKQAVKDTVTRPERVDPAFPQTYQYSDVPSPATYQLDPEASWAYAYGTVRTGGMTYRGNGRAVEASEFYKSEMPRNGWTFQGETLIGRTNHLVFAKEHDRCDVAIHDDLHETRILVSLEYQ